MLEQTFGEVYDGLWKFRGVQELFTVKEGINTQWLLPNFERWGLVEMIAWHTAIQVPEVRSILYAWGPDLVKLIHSEEGEQDETTAKIAQMGEYAWAARKEDIDLLAASIAALSGRVEGLQSELQSEIDERFHSPPCMSLCNKPDRPVKSLKNRCGLP